MKLIPQSPKKALKAFLKQKPLRSEFNVFKKNLIELLDTIEEIEKQPKDESEEHLKNNIRDFLLGAYYRGNYAINTKDKKDLVIHLENKPTSKVGVIIEAKRPSNKNEMLTAASPNKKALHELILYYLDERSDKDKDGNFAMTQLVATNINEWYIIDANHFDKHIYNNKQIQDLYKTKVKDKKTSPFFYQEVEKIIAKMEVDIPCIYFDIKDYNTALRNDNKEDDKDLVALFKVLSPSHLLKLEKANDSNYLDKKFYDELLHIIGLEEAKEGGKSIIRRKLANKNPASLIEMALKKLQTKGIHKIPDVTSFGDTTDEQHFNIALELCITWVNRILFLKLLEGQLKAYHVGNEAYKFLYTKTIHDFDELFKLFHNVLAINIKERDNEVQKKYSLVPYLNSSLFEISELEDLTISIESLDNSEVLPFNTGSILSEHKKENNGFKSLDYLFKFLDAYDFASEGTEGIQEDSKKMINASVLGKVFEKINGYKDGSIYTPGFITMHMCRKSIRLAVVQKFKDKYGWNIETFEDIKNYLADRKTTKDILEFNALVNSLRLCDPAVGSGHYLVSSLNELIVIKYELGILADDKGNRIRDYEISIENDELFITNENGDPFEYTLQNGKPKSTEIQRLQKTLFHEKQTIIENCLFGVDINPNSVKICRLRLWIELLKNAYYKDETNYTELETLPNIDINIKCGNSLLSRFKINENLKEAFSKQQFNLATYKIAVETYKNSTKRGEKRELLDLIEKIKKEYTQTIYSNDPRRKRLSEIRGKIELVKNNFDLFGKKMSDKDAKMEERRLTLLLQQKESELKEAENGKLYHNAFEWRFEFPEILNSEGDFMGFDVVVGNPPYIRQEEIRHLKNYLQSEYRTYSSTSDLYVFFVEKGFEILKSNSYLSYIMPNKWMQAAYGKPLRSFLLDNKILSIIDFGDLQVFDSVTTYPCILNASKTNASSSFDSVVIKTLQFERGFDNYVQLNSNKIKISNLSDENWVISSGLEQSLLNKIKTNSTTLFDFIGGSAHYGIKTGLTEAFLINTETKEHLIKEDKNSESLIKPFLLGRNIKPFASSKASNWLILIPKGFTIKRNLPPDNIHFVNEPPPRYGNMPYDDAWEWFNENYPAIAKHLLPFKSKAEKRTDKGDYWWELRACDYYNEFELPKIMYQVLQVKPCFIYDTSKQYCNNSMWIIPKDDKFLVGLLNSKMGWWLISKYCTAIQNGFQLIWQYFGQIPIPNEKEKEKKQIESLVEKVLKSREQGRTSTENEKEIDRLVYKLYDITEEEQRIIEGNNGAK